MDLDSLVIVDEGLISREIFTNEDIYRLEQEKIFGKCWLYLAHESQLKNPGDYVTTYMGEDPVLVIRGEDGKIGAFLNLCRHRGTKLCVRDEGNSFFFTCPYHGWTYNSEGRLTGVPLEKIAYPNLDKSEWGLIQVPRLVNYKGTIWGNWDPEAPSFEEYLGDMKPYFDMFLDRYDGNMKIYGGVHRWIIPVNWKIPSENFMGDSYHALFTHKSAVEVRLRNPYSPNDFEISTKNGHGFGAQVGGTGRGVEASEEYKKILWESIDKIADKMGDFVRDIMPLGHLHIFPNFSVLDLWPYTFLRVWNPKGPEKTEVRSWLVVDGRVSEEENRKIAKKFELEFGPGGVFEQDDAEVWFRISETLRGPMGRKVKLNYQGGLGMEKEASSVLGPNARGILGAPFGETNQRMFYKRWLELLKG
ncbi:aromatic ring-hydroxylating oxygenase subunit alpha [Metallosphaera javensis (ex Sakai et al. 2022)]|uniref:aromatic ring-hydroxylating oxygenase subunit alpha n=1 Tax=Metallosphaera javensis (ex Sakai et al. 2022) TaxID=2775498 RepID=UPI00258D8E80|nr:MAG: 3-phenylpropionate/cinnamic acid dioxygenase subunit alpha [Metallosphaera javensis (ex Sakai et al. 2022)]